MDPEVSPAKVRIGAIRWYAGKARSNRGRFFWIRGYQILVASVIPLVSLFGAWSAQRYVSAALGASIAIAEGLQQLGQFQQNWHRYRAAREALQREQFLYEMSAGPYATTSDKLRLFVERADSVMGGEASKWLTWAERSEGTQTQSQTTK